MKSKVIAEIGCNHKGSLEIAIDMVKSAAQCGADIAKFQKRAPKECLRKEIYEGPHPNQANSYGTTYGLHRENLELTLQDHSEIKSVCEKNNIEYSCTPFDLTSAKQILELEPKHVKISSFHNNYDELIGFILDNYNSKIHISLGMTTKLEMENLMSLISSYSRLKDVVLYWCTSAYPCTAEHLYLREIKNLVTNYQESVNSIGFSGHHDGIAMDIMAYCYGARYFERHFTLDHNWKGTDHKASLEPSGLTRLIRDLGMAENADNNKNKGISEVEKHNRNFHKYQPT